MDAKTGPKLLKTRSRAQRKVIRKGILVRKVKKVKNRPVGRKNNYHSVDKLMTVNLMK